MEKHLIVYRDNAGDIFDCTKRAVECLDKTDLIDYLKKRFSGLERTHDMDDYKINPHCFDDRLGSDVYDIVFFNKETKHYDAFGWVNFDTTKDEMLKNLNKWKKQQEDAKRGAYANGKQAKGVQDIINSFADGSWKNEAQSYIEDMLKATEKNEKGE